MNSDKYKSDFTVEQLAASTTRSTAPLFPLGSTVATPGALDLLHRNGINASDYLKRHQRGDFGDLCPSDIQENMVAITHGSRILSAYNIQRDRLWVITEADRSVTTLLLPSEY